MIKMKPLPRRKTVVLIICVCSIAYILGCVLLPPLFNTQENGSAAQPMTESIGERIRLIDDNSDALYWRLCLIEAAREEIILSTFDFRDDNSGRDIMAALYYAAERGVHIRIIIDGVIGKMKLWNSDNFKALIAHENVEGKFYNPAKLTALWRINYRLHDKYLLIDDRAYILGGRNTNDLFLGNYSEESNIDRDVLVYNDTTVLDSSLSALRCYFEEVWALEENQTLNYNADRKKAKSSADFLAAHLESLQAKLGDFADIDWYADTIPAEGICLLTNGSVPYNKNACLWNTLSELMMSGEESVVIQTPYVICKKSMYSTLENVCLSVDSVTIATNAAESGANPWGCADYLNQRSGILNTGAAICESASKQSIHTKTILIDDQISVIGSFNLDARSTYLDTEMMLVIQCPALNTELRRQIIEMESESKLFFPDGSEIIGADYTPVEMSFGKTMLYFAMRILIRPFRYLL